MKIFIMRHGEAEVVSSSDEARHLTDYGRKQSILQGQWLKNHLNSTGTFSSESDCQSLCKSTRNV